MSAAAGPGRFILFNLSGRANEGETRSVLPHAVAGMEERI
jgi:hypothetical protein